VLGAVKAIDSDATHFSSKDCRHFGSNVSVEAMGKYRLLAVRV